MAGDAIELVSALLIHGFRRMRMIKTQLPHERGDERGHAHRYSGKALAGFKDSLVKRAKRPNSSGKKNNLERLVESLVMMQSFGGKDLYPMVEEKSGACSLFHREKDHPSNDGISEGAYGFYLVFE